MPKAGLLVTALGLILPPRDLTLRRKSGEHLAGWGGCVWSEHFISGEPRELLTLCGCGRGTWSASRCLTATLLTTVPVGSPGLCGDQQVASQAISAQGHTKGFEGLPPLSAEAEGRRKRGPELGSSQADPFFWD